MTASSGVRVPARDMAMNRIRLIADDLTGALDTAAELVPIAGEIAVGWRDGRESPAASVALDLATREGSRDAAVKAAAAAAPLLRRADIAFLKIDSLLRGHGIAELGAILSHGGFASCMLAPAFPYQGRTTRGGVQCRRTPGGASENVADLLRLLADEGLMARRVTTDMLPRRGISVFDAETDDDLDRVAVFGWWAPGPVLWCGTAGLAAALARQAPRYTRPSVEGPVLGLFGSDQSTTATQLAACGDAWTKLTNGSPASAASLAEALRRRGAALASLSLPSGLSRAEAAGRQAEAFGALALRLPRPGTLLIAGGETLRALCDSLGADALDVIGQIEPGLPVSLMRGGHWDGLRVISKSGAFGGPNLLRDLIAPVLATMDSYS